MVGGNRGLWALRIPLEHLGARVYPDMFSLAQAHLAFVTTGRSPMRSWAAALSNAGRLHGPGRGLDHYPCVKSAWVEYLGERPEPAIDRVQ